MAPEKHCIMLFLKSPERATVKTRLARDIGEEAAKELYRNFVLDILETLDGIIAELNCDLRICFAPPEAGEHVRTWLGNTYEYHPQQGDDLGERMKHAFVSAFRDRYTGALLLGSDIPDLPAEIIRQALGHLLTDDVVIGPAPDGGYYLLGFRSDSFQPAVFQDIIWSSGNVLDNTRDILVKAAVTVALLPIWRDIDTLADLKDFRQNRRNCIFTHSRTLNYLDTLGWGHSTGPMDSIPDNLTPINGISKFTKLFLAKKTQEIISYLLKVTGNRDK